jgi:uncharacterized protein YndB with AHSA1/START domain
MNNEIIQEWTFQETPAMIWSYLTQPELVATWLMPSNIRPELGQEFEFTTKPMPSFNLDGIFRCKVLESKPHKRLVYTWTGGPGNGEITLDTVVEWDLEKVKDGTRLKLKQTGFTDDTRDVFMAMTSGWQQNIVKMQKHMQEHQAQSEQNN